MKAVPIHTDSFVRVLNVHSPVARWGPGRVVRGELVGEQPGREALSVLHGASIGITPEKGGKFEAYV